VPAPHRSPIAATVRAPAAISRRTTLHETPLHKQTSMTPDSSTASPFGY
jgi:hypothetical protein